MSKTKVITDLWSLLGSEITKYSKVFKLAWLKEGCDNICLFHACGKIRRRRRIVIFDLNVSNSLVEWVFEIHYQVDSFLSNHLREPLSDHTQLNELNFCTLFDKVSDTITTHFLLSKLDQVVSHCYGNENPGMDYFYFTFMRMS